MYKKYFENKKAVFFDLDGTIANTRIIREPALKSVGEEIGLNTNPATLFPSGVTLKEKWKYIKKLFGVAKDIKIEDLVNKTNDKTLELLKTIEIEPLEGFFDLLFEIKEERKMKVAVVTNTSTGIALEILKAMDLDKSFDLVIGGDKVKNQKPSPAIYKKALRELKLHPKDVLVFEDSLVGVKSAIKAKIDTLVIWNLNHHQYEYDRRALEFFPNFVPLVGNTNVTPNEYNVRELQKREQILKEEN